MSVVLWPEEGDLPENLYRVVCVIMNKCSFESFMILLRTAKLNSVNDNLQMRSWWHTCD